jgi:hypothetical protein
MYYKCSEFFTTGQNAGQNCAANMKECKDDLRIEFAFRDVQGSQNKDTIAEELAMGNERRLGEGLERRSFGKNPDRSLTFRGEINFGFMRD